VVVRCTVAAELGPLISPRVLTSHMSSQPLSGLDWLSSCHCQWSSRLRTLPQCHDTGVPAPWRLGPEACGYPSAEWLVILWVSILVMTLGIKNLTKLYAASCGMFNSIGWTVEVTCLTFFDSFEFWIHACAKARTNSGDTGCRDS
jgi:hypothetical protein